MSKKWMCSLQMVRRMAISIILWLAFGLLCAYLASTWASIPENYWWSALMWNIIFNRFLIWVMIAFAWFVTFHPILKMRMYPAIRWAIFWALVSFDISFWPFISWAENAKNLLFATVIAWAIYWLIIDLVATKVGWEWMALTEWTWKI